MTLLSLGPVAYILGTRSPCYVHCPAVVRNPPTSYMNLRSAPETFNRPTLTEVTANEKPVAKVLSRSTQLRQNEGGSQESALVEW